MWRLKRLISKIAKCEFKNQNKRILIKEQRIHLGCGEDIMTGDLGVHTALLVNNIWYSSADGVWQVDLKKDSLHITVDWRDIPIRQLMVFKRETTGFNWTVYMDVKQRVQIKKMLAGIMVGQLYEEWFSGVEDGVFPAFNNAWENIFLQDEKGKIFGVNKNNDLPGIIYENLQQGSLLLQNSPNSNLIRALRVEVNNCEEFFDPNRYKIFNTAIHIFEDKQEQDEFRAEKNKQLLCLRQLEEGNLRLSFEDNSVHLFWKGVQLTSKQGLHTALMLNNEWFDSSKCEWKVERINDQCIYINIDWRPLPIKQTWQVNLINGYSFRWQVINHLKDNRDDLVKIKTLGVVLRADYQKWFGGYETGDFPNSFDRWQEMISDVPDGAVGVKQCAAYPAVMLKNVADNRAGLIVQNGDNTSGSRHLQAVQDENDGNFAQEISIIEDAQQVDDYVQKRMNNEIMRNGIGMEHLKLLADKQKIRVFWQEKELTTDIGLHTAIHSSGCWYDSGKMKWLVKKITEKNLQITVDFSPFPAVQVWDLSLEGKDTIDWDVEMELKNPVEIEERKAGIILNGEYTRWFNSFEEGMFPEKFGFWHDIVRNRDGETFGTYPHKDLPGVMFSIDASHLSLIQNADENIKGRVLQAQIVEAEQTKQYPAKKFSCFKGKIKLVKDEGDIAIYKQNAHPLLAKAEAVYIYGDSAGLHDRITGVKEFDKKIEIIDELRTKGQEVRVAIGVSRYNFFKLNEIGQFVADKLGYPLDMRSVQLNIFPLKRLRRNFIEYLDELKKLLGQIGNVELVLADNELFELITAVCSQADSGNERQLLRLLGVISEHAFIGPQIIVIDPFHRCNANCVHCWVHTPGVFHPEEFYDIKLDFDRFKSIADDLSELLVDLIIFQGDGEPLLYDKFFDMVRYARKKGIKVSFFTNGILLNKEIAREVIDLGVEEIFCSLPAGIPETFGKINTKQKPEILTKILENLKYLSALKKQAGKENPRLIMTHVIHTMNARELMAMAKNDIDIGADIVRFYLVRLDENIEFLKLKPEDIKAVQDILPEIKELFEKNNIKFLDTTEFQLNNFEQETGSWSKNVFLENGCTLGWNFCLIPASGEVSFCCHLRTVGFLNKSTFKEIWISPEYDRFRYQAKFLNQNKDAKFLNGHPLFDDFCEHCDTHQVIRDVWDQFKLYNLERFFLKK
ncbi:MAG: radical SAM protein [Candidatus Omnitrophota bacterium]